MHPSAMRNCQSFFDVYGKHKDGGSVIDIGSQNVNGSLKEIVPITFTYTGIDFQEAPGVDIVLTDPYTLPLPDNSVDIVLSSSCLEHSEFFWLTFDEMVRVAKPDGLIYLNVPSEGHYHAYPVDCYRFQIDASMALMRWSQRQGSTVTLIEAFTDSEKPWHDLVAIYVKSKDFAHTYPDRIDPNEL